MFVTVLGNAGEAIGDVLRELFHGHSEIEHYGLPAFWILVFVGLIAYASNH